MSGAALTGQPVINAVNAVGLVDTDYVTLCSVAKATGDGTVAGSDVNPMVSGVATFTDVTITASAADKESYTMTFSSDALTAVTSGAVTCEVVATALTVATQPTSIVSGVSMTQPVVNYVDAGGLVDVDVDADVLTISEGGDGSLAGTLTATATDGVATFSTLVYTALADGEAVTFTFTDDALSLDLSGAPANSAAQTADVVATKLVFTTQPAGSISGAALTTQPVVQAHDAGDLLDTGYTDDVVAAEDDIGALTGTTTKAAVAGVATFTDLTYTATADPETFQIDVASGGLTGATSNDIVSVKDSNGEISVSTIAQAIAAGKGNQALALITITDTGGDAISGTTRLAAPAGVTFNTSASVDMIVSSTGTLTVTGHTLTSTLLTITHGVSASAGNTLRMNGLVIDTAADITADADGATDLGTPDNVKINYALGSFSATNLLKVYKPDIAQTASLISAGGTGESLSNLIITTNGAAGQIGNNTNIMIYAPTSKGIMFDESQTITVSGTAGRVNATAAVVASGSITLPVIADWSAGNAITIEGIKVNTTAAAENGALTVNVTAASPSTGVVQADVDAVSNIAIQKPTFTFGDTSTVIVGGHGQAMAHDLTIDSTTAGDLTMVDVSGGTGWINLTLNNTGVTFDKSADDVGTVWETALLTITGNYSGCGDDDVIVTDDKLAIKLTLTDVVDADDKIVLSSSSLKVNVSDTVEDGAVFRFDITTTPSAGLEIEGSTGDNVVTAEKPAIGAIAASTDIAIGASGSALTGTLVIDSEIAGDLTMVDAIDGTGWINLTLNNTAVTFDKSVDDVGTVWEVALLTLPDHDAPADADVIVTDDKLAIKLTLAAGAAADDVVTIDIAQVQLNVTADANLDDANVLFHVNTTPETGSNVRNDSTAAAKLVLPTLEFAEKTIVVDADYINGTAINSITVTAEAADAADIYPGANAWVNLTITGGSGVTFDKSDAYVDVIVGGTAAFVGAGKFVITDTKVAVQVTTGTAHGETVVFTPSVNATAGATNTTLSVVTNPGSVSITQALTNQIIVTDIELTGVTGNAEFTTGETASTDFGATDTAKAIATVTVGTVTTGAVYVSPSGVSAGNVGVTLAIVEAPAGATGQALNASSITTGPDDIAYFNFTVGDLVGTYIVNATLPGVAGGVNMTYTATAGSVNGISVTPIENAIAGLSGDAGNATLWVNLTDAYGNPVDSGAATTLTLGGGGYVTVNAYDDLTATGEGTLTDHTTLTGSTLTIDSADGSSVIELTNTVAESVNVTVAYGSYSDMGTVIFYGPIATVTLELNDSEVVVGENVTANATIKQSDGTVIEVPDVAMVFDDSTNANTSFVAPSAHATTITVDTNGDGVASATVRADSDGTSTLNALTSMRQGSAVLTINQPTLSLSLNATSVAVGVETPVLATVVFQHNGTKAEGVTINVTGAGVTVAEQDTDANGNATCTVNATSAGTITVNATKTGCVLGTATVTAGAAPTIDTITIAPTGPLTMNTTETQTFTATCYNDSTEVTGITVTWASSNETVGTIDASGVFTAEANGTTTINATAQGVTSNAVTVTVGGAESLIDRYDTDNDGVISKDEALTAISDYFDDKISKEDALEVIMAYFG